MQFFIIFATVATVIAATLAAVTTATATALEQQQQLFGMRFDNRIENGEVMR